MTNITEKNVILEVQKPDGSRERQFPITKIENIIGAKKIIEKGSTKQISALRLLALNPYLVDDITGDIYRIGISEGRLYYVPVDMGINEILDEIDAIVSGTEN